MLKLKVLENIDLISAELANLITKRVEISIQNDKPYFIALSGGNTPKRLYEIMNEQLISSNLQFNNHLGIIQIDERWYNKHHDRSNQHMISNTLKLVDQLEHYYPIPTTDTYPTAEDAVPDYETTLKEIISYYDIINLGIFGMGQDGHTASLFPEDPILEDLTNNFVVSGYVESQKEYRITLTPSFFQHIKQKIFIITGAEKGSIFRDALKTKKSKVFPILLAIDNQSLVFLDQAAYDAYKS